MHKRDFVTREIFKSHLTLKYYMKFDARYFAGSKIV